MFQSLQNAWQRLRRDQNGNFITLFALSAPVIMVAAGVAIDFSHGISEEAKMQAALDSAVLEGAKVEAANVATLGAAPAQALAITAAQNIFAANLPWTGPTTSFRFSGSALLGTASYAMPAMYSGFTGRSAVNLNVASNASIPSPATPACILLLSKTATGITQNAGTNIQGPTCQIDTASANNPAAYFNRGGTMNLAETCVAGSIIVQNGGAINNLVTSCPTPANPFLGKLPAPTSTTCSPGLQYGGNYSGTLTLSPGVYCGYYNFNGATNVTLKPGLYVISGGGWNVNGGNWTGSGVTFYFADSSGIQFNSGMSLSLSPPSTGTYAQILMYENDSTVGSQNYTTAFIFNDSLGETLSGLIYLPKRNITFNSTSNQTTPNISVVALTAIFNNMNWTLTPNTTWPIPGGGSSSSSSMATLSQ